MGLKNIQNRKDFTKINEFFGGTTGGAGDKDGFANNAKLGDTYLGKLMDGIFGGIGKLWRKSKERFTINRLIAQLINELYRGIILFCFANEIDLSSGVDSTEGDEIEGDSGEDGFIGDDLEEEPDSEQEPERDLEADFGTEETEEIVDEPLDDDGELDDLSKYSREELLERINRLTEGINEDIKKIKDKEGQINLDGHMVHTGSYTVKEKEKRQALITRLKKEVIFLKKELVKSKAELIRLKEALKKLEDGENYKSKFGILKVACEKKYKFNPKMEHLPIEPTDFVDIDSMSVIGFSKKLSLLKYNSEYIKIGQPFSIVDNDGKIFQIITWDVDNSTNEVIYKTANSKLKRVKDTRLLPKNFPKLREPALECDDFLDKYISSYETMDEDRKEKMETIYMQYKVISEINKVRRVSMIQESIGYIDVVLESSVKLKTDDPKAGNTSLIKNTAIKSGVASVNVSDILTKKDKEKYSEKSDKFKIKIKNINLANIEKTIDKLQENDSTVKSKVASYVNPYNLKTIQISAEQLMGSNKDDKSNSLKLTWDKELAQTYAAFNGLMDMSKVDISGGGFGASIGSNDKVKKGTDKMTKDITTQIDTNKVMEKLPLEYDSSSYNKMKNGDFTYYSFTYPGKSKLYNTTLSPVSSVFKDFGLICVTSSFTDYENEQAISDAHFESTFISNRSDETSSDIVNVYFLFKHDQRFPSRNTPRLTKVFVLNEYIIGGVSHLSIKKINQGSKNIAINNSSVSNLNKNEYIFNIESVSLHKFKANEVDSIASQFNFVRSTDPKTNTDFRVGLTQPSFLTEDMNKYIKKLSEKL